MNCEGFPCLINSDTKRDMPLMRSGTPEWPMRELRHEDGERDEDARQPGLADPAGVWEQLDSRRGEPGLVRITGK